jgi:hypothetical protein
MNQILYEKICRCNSIRSSTNLSEGKLLPYIKKPLYEIEGIEEIPPKIFTFQIKYEKKLSSIAKFILNSFQNKYIYYAIDDILYLLSSNPIERDELLRILYSSMLSLHNEFTINFFDIWIDSVYLNETFQTNRFCTYQTKNLNQIQTTTIILKLRYFKRSPIKKSDPLW